MARKIKTLIPEPNWDKLQKSAKDEESRFKAWQTAADFVKYEIDDRGKIHALKKWITRESGWDLPDDRFKALPDVYLLAFADHGWKHWKFGWIPEQVVNHLNNHLRPLYDEAFVFRDKMYQETGIHSSVLALDEDAKLHPTKVKQWIAAWKGNKDDASKRYVSNMNTYLRTGIWTDSHYGLNREFKAIPICVALAYDREGLAKRTEGVFYPDLGFVWKKN